MTDLKSLKVRIGGIKNTQKMTKAMQMVAAAKLFHARLNAEESRKSYSNIVTSYDNLHKKFNESSSIDYDSKYIANPAKASHLFVLITTDRGLCGGLNSNLTKHTLKRIKELEEKNIKVSLAIYGKKSYEQIKAKDAANIIFNRQYCLEKDFSEKDGEVVKDEIFSLIEKEDIGNASIIYSKFNSPIAQEVTEEPLLIEQSSDDSEDSLASDTDFETSFADYLDNFLDLKLIFQIVHAMKESYASEQGARMTAMDSAANNCKDLVAKLSLIYNRTRQAKITTELIEIIAAAESL